MRQTLLIVGGIHASANELCTERYVAGGIQRGKSEALKQHPIWHAWRRGAFTQLPFPANPAVPHQIDSSLAVVTPSPVICALKAIAPALFSTGEHVEAGEVNAGYRARYLVILKSDCNVSALVALRGHNHKSATPTGEKQAEPKCQRRDSIAVNTMRFP